MALRGGYAGVGTDPNDRDFGASESVLCGDLAGDDVGRTNTGENSFQVVAAVDVDETTILDGFTITGGHASGATLEIMHGGGIYNSGGGATIINCRLTGNQADQGGGMYNNSSSPRVVNCYIMGNRAYDSGGGVYDDSADAVFMNCLFSGNRAEDSGGGVFHNGGEVTFNNCTFSGNWASNSGSGIYAEAGIVEISNCIIQEEISLDGGSVVARYSNLPGGLGGEGSIDAAPLFIDADGEDDVFGTVDDNVRLGVDSPCINAGDPMRMTDPNETDLDGRQRINDGAVDMGAYEFFIVPALVGHWKLDEEVGSTAYDSVEANDGSLEGDPVWMPGDGRIDRALAFDGAQPDISNCIFWNNAEGNTDEGCQSRHSWDWEPVEAAAHWKFDEGDGTAVYDSVGSSDGTVYGPVWTEGQAAKGALDFDGNDDYVLVTSSPAISVGTGNYTLSAWIKPELTSYIHVIMSKISSQQDKEYMLSIDRDRIRLDVEKNENAGRAYSVEVVTLDTWQHVAVTFDASELTATFYYNGLPVEQAVSADPITLVADSLGADLWIGMRGGATYDDREFIGAIDEVVIFNGVLSAEEMQVVYKSQLSPLFADPENNDYHLLSEKGRFVPLDLDINNGLEGLWTFDAVTSPCVDGGDPAERPWRERMPNGGRVNPGAYGNTLYASMSKWPIEGDINRNGVVNLADLAIMARQWLSALPWATSG